MAKGCRIGKEQEGSVVLTVWENMAQVDGRQVPLPNYTLNRIYSRGVNAKPEYTYSFREADLPKIVKVIDRYLSGQENGEPGESG